jgi:lysyl-tRNA synthetase class II
MYEFDSRDLSRLADLRSAGVNPYPHHLSITHTLAEALAMMGEREKSELDEDETEVTVVDCSSRMKWGRQASGAFKIVLEYARSMSEKIPLGMRHLLPGKNHLWEIMYISGLVLCVPVLANPV